MPAENICVIGLGSMGMGAAKSCLRAGLNTWGVDLNPAALKNLRQAGARDAQPSASAFADQLDAVL
ncbi:oxidoreductase, partial [Pantoea agglomerans]|nr:oxidoreductase [Pantoea agglomerans]